VDNFGEALWRSAVQSSDQVWPELQNALRNRASTAEWRSSLSTLRFVDISDRLVTLATPNQIQLTRIRERFMPMLNEEVEALVGPGAHVELEVASGPAEERDPTDRFAEEDRPAPKPAAFLTAIDRPGRLDPRMSFDNFVPGNSNRLAFAAAQTVAETPGRAYNPLLIYGNSGLGKTHLLHAIGNYIAVNYPQKRILYVSTETFLNDFIRAIQSRTQMALHDRYRECDVLLIDDIQFMETRGGSFHEEIFHTYNSLHSDGKQIVLTADRSPRDLAGIQERLRSRLLQGLITEIDQPDLETRIAILRTKAEADGVDLPGDVVEFIANRVRDNIRELEGSITMLRAFANLRQEPITLELARKHLTNLGQEQVVLKPETIIEVVAEFYGLSVEEVRGPKRLRPLVNARHVAMFLMRDLLADYSYPMIAKIFDDRNHTTVISAVEKIKAQLPQNKELFAQVDQLRRTLQSDH
jgi:chromosomal replication initiator protein